jgi:hypothetical protein
MQRDCEKKTVGLGETLEDNSFFGFQLWVQNIYICVYLHSACQEIQLSFKPNLFGPFPFFQQTKSRYPNMTWNEGGNS